MGQQHRSGDDFDFAGQAGFAIALGRQSHHAAVFAHQFGLGEDVADFNAIAVFNDGFGQGRQVVHFPREDPRQSAALGDAGGVALAVFALFGHQSGKLDFAANIGCHVFGGFFRGFAGCPTANGHLSQKLIAFDRFAVLDHQGRTLGEGIGFLATVLAFEDEFPFPLDYEGILTVAGSEGASADVFGIAHPTVRGGAGLTGDFAGEHAPGVERTHGELGARFADGLSGDNPDGFAQVYGLGVSQAPAIAFLANAAASFAGQGRSHHDFVHLLAQLFGQLAGDVLVALGDRFAVDFDIPGEHPTHEAIFEGNQHAIAIGHGADGNAALGTAIALAHDRVLADVHQAASQITRVSGSQCRIDQSLTGTVRGNNVFGNGQSFAEVGFNRQVDNFALGIRHQAPHSDELAHLGNVPPRPGERHHVNRVERVGFAEVFDDRVFEFVAGAAPGIDHFLKALDLGDFPARVAQFRRVNFLLSGVEEILFGRRNLQVIDADRYPGFGGVPEAQVFEGVGELCRSCRAVIDKRPSHELLELLFTYDPVPKNRLVCFLCHSYFSDWQ